MSEAEDTLRQWIIGHSPEIRRDVEHLAGVLREAIALERTKAGLDDPHGSIELWPNKDRKAERDPHWVGIGKITGRSYRASAWISDSKIKIGLYPPKRQRK